MFRDLLNAGERVKSVFLQNFCFSGELYCIVWYGIACHLKQCSKTKFMTERKESVENQLNNNFLMMFKVYLFPDSTAGHFLSCLTYSVYNQLQSISSNDWIVNHYEDLDPMNILCSPTALTLFFCAASVTWVSGLQSNWVSLENNVQERCFCSEMFKQKMLLFFLLLNTTASTGAVLLWVNFLLLGQMKTSPSFVATVFLRSLNQPKAFCSACGAALVLPCSSSPLYHLLFYLLFWSQAKMLHTFWQDLRPFQQAQ